MHWVEGIISIAAGCIPLLIALEQFPADPVKREEMRTKAPWLGNRKLLWGLSIFLWLFGLAAVIGII
ncbi:MAG: hypothetical protein JSV21_05415 [Nitrospirota bacterium]|nr:MAG: hypothetical protein JSV21_05415 [Nitrospirota bacterium]